MNIYKKNVWIKMNKKKLIRKNIKKWIWKWKWKKEHESWGKADYISKYFERPEGTQKDVTGLDVLRNCAWKKSACQRGREVLSIRVCQERLSWANWRVSVRILFQCASQYTSVYLKKNLQQQKTHSLRSCSAQKNCIKSSISNSCVFLYSLFPLTSKRQKDVWLSIPEAQRLAY